VIRAATQPALDVGLLPQDDVLSAAALASEAESLGFGGVWVADSPGVFREAFVTLGACAMSTRRVRLATGVTNPVTRDVTVLAGASASLAEATEGRMVLGIGVGESAVYNAGKKPATLNALEAAVRSIRELIEAGSTSRDGATSTMAYRSPAVPIVIGASGPRTLRLAGRIADGVLFQVGAAPSLIAYALEQIRRGAADVGRDMSEIEICARLACVADDDAESAREQMRTYASIAANTVAQTVPEDAVPAAVRAPLQRLRENYDYASHGMGAANHRELVTDEIFDAVAVVATPAVAATRLREIISLGVDRIVIPLNVDDKRRLMTTLAERVLPNLVDGASAYLPAAGGEG